MSKSRTPLFSLDAHGSLGDILTYQGKHGVTIIRKKPVPVQPNTLAQIYHRWDYQDYANLWHALSDAQKQQYESDARRRKITGFNLWMSQHLSNLSDILARWPLDEQAGTKIFDTSKNTNTGTIFGALRVPGLWGNALSFDGLDDAVRVANHPSLWPTTALTIEAYLYPLSPAELSYIFFQDNSAPDYTFALFASASKYRLYFYNTLGVRVRATGPVIIADAWVHLIVTYLAPNIIFYLDSVPAISVNVGVHTIHQPDRALYLGNVFAGGTGAWPGLIEYPAMYNVGFTQSRVTQHFERSIPP